jgi:hypothetical protein
MAARPTAGSLRVRSISNGMVPMKAIRLRAPGGLICMRTADPKAKSPTTTATTPRSRRTVAFSSALLVAMGSHLTILEDDRDSQAAGLPPLFGTPSYAV